MRIFRRSSPARMVVTALAGVSILVTLWERRSRGERYLLSLQHTSEDCGVSECAADGVPLSSYAG